MKKIIDFMRLNGKRSSINAGEFITSKSDGSYLCHFIENGMAVFFSDINSRSLITISGPYVVGLNQVLHPEEGFLIKMIHPSVVYSLPAKNLFDMISKDNLWSVLASHLSELVFQLHSINRNRKNEDNTSLIFSTLQSLQKESEEVRLAHTVIDYVSAITGLSSSTVSRRIDTLKKEHCIDIHNGLLIRLRENSDGPK